MSEHIEEVVTFHIQKYAEEYKVMKAEEDTNCNRTNLSIEIMGYIERIFSDQENRIKYMNMYYNLRS